MFIVLLEFSGKKAQAGQFMEGHKEWIRRGFEEGIFLLTGSLQPGKGGVIIAHNTNSEDLEKKLSEDPFVAQGVVTAEVHEISPSKTDERLDFLFA